MFAGLVSQDVSAVGQSFSAKKNAVRQPALVTISSMIQEYNNYFNDKVKPCFSKNTFQIEPTDANVQILLNAQKQLKAIEQRCSLIEAADLVWKGVERHRSGCLDRVNSFYSVINDGRNVNTDYSYVKVCIGSMDAAAKNQPVKAAIDRIAHILHDLGKDQSKKDQSKYNVENISLLVDKYKQSEAQIKEISKKLQNADNVKTKIENITSLQNLFVGPAPKSAPVGGASATQGGGKSTSDTQKRIAVQTESFDSESAKQAFEKQIEGLAPFIGSEFGDVNFEPFTTFVSHSSSSDDDAPTIEELNALVRISCLAEIVTALGVTDAKINLLKYWKSSDYAYQASEQSLIFNFYTQAHKFLEKATAWKNSSDLFIDNDLALAYFAEGLFKANQAVLEVVDSLLGEVAEIKNIITMLDEQDSLKVESFAAFISGKTELNDVSLDYEATQAAFAQNMKDIETALKCSMSGTQGAMNVIQNAPVLQLSTDKKVSRMGALLTENKSSVTHTQESIKTVHKDHAIINLKRALLIEQYRIQLMRNAFLAQETGDEVVENALSDLEERLNGAATIIIEADSLNHNIIAKIRELLINLKKMIAQDNNLKSLNQSILPTFEKGSPLKAAKALDNAQKSLTLSQDSDGNIAALTKDKDLQAEHKKVQQAYSNDVKQLKTLTGAIESASQDQKSTWGYYAKSLVSSVCSSVESVAKPAIVTGTALTIAYLADSYFNGGAGLEGLQGYAQDALSKGQELGCNGSPQVDALEQALNQEKNHAARLQHQHDSEFGVALIPPAENRVAVIPSDPNYTDARCTSPGLQQYSAQSGYCYEEGNADPYWSNTCSLDEAPNTSALAIVPGQEVTDHYVDPRTQAQRSFDALSKYEGCIDDLCVCAAEVPKASQGWTDWIFSGWTPWSQPDSTKIETSTEPEGVTEVHYIGVIDRRCEPLCTADEAGITTCHPQLVVPNVLVTEEQLSSGSDAVQKALEEQYPTAQCSSETFTTPPTPILQPVNQPTSDTTLPMPPTDAFTSKEAQKMNKDLNIHLNNIDNSKGGLPMPNFEFPQASSFIPSASQGAQVIGNLGSAGLAMSGAAPTCMAAGTLMGPAAPVVTPACLGTAGLAGSGVFNTLVGFGSWFMNAASPIIGSIGS
jgi:hypothetical protein